MVSLVTYKYLWKGYGEEFNNDLIKVYENDYIEEIYEIFGKNLKDNSRNTVKSKVKNFIKTYLE